MKPLLTFPKALKHITIKTMPLSLKSHHPNDESQLQLLQPEQPQSPQPMPKSRQQLRASPPEQDHEQVLSQPIERELEPSVGQELQVQVPLDREREQQGKKSLLGGPYWKRAVNRSLRVRKDPGIRALGNNDNDNQHNRLRREGAYSDGDDLALTTQHQNHHNISSLPTNHLLNQPMTMTTIPIKDHGDSNSGPENMAMRKNTLGLSLDTNQKNAVTSAERSFIHVGLLVLAYTCGVHAPGAYPLVRRLAEYLVVAWLTCRIILLLSHWNRRRSNNHALIESVSISSATQIPPPPPAIQSRALLVDDDDYDHVDTDQDDDVHDGDRGGQIQTPALMSDPTVPQPHPALEHLFIINTSNGQRFVPNSTEVFILDNAIFKGRMLTMVRTPDVDHPDGDDAARGTAPNHSQQHFASYFAQKQRRFEFQWQLKLKQKVRTLAISQNKFNSPFHRACTHLAIVVHFLHYYIPSTTFSLYSPTAKSSSLANWRIQSKWESSNVPWWG